LKEVLAPLEKEKEKPIIINDIQLVCLTTTTTTTTIIINKQPWGES
jgi:frataxin-like iron-binding protein CyaY